MDSQSTAQLDQASVEYSQKSFQSTFIPHPPSSPAAPPSASVASLPHELLNHVFESIPSHPSSERVSTLASLCLVNRFFRDIAQPLLYYAVHLDIGQDFDDERTRYRQLYKTLLESERSADLVRVIKLSAGKFGDDNLVNLVRILSRCKRVECIRMGWHHRVKQDESLVRTIVNHQPRLKSLEITPMRLTYETLNTIFSTLTELETYKGRLPGPAVHEEEEDERPLLPELSCQLRKVALTIPTHPECFQQMLRFSHQTLTSLGITLLTDLNRHFSSTMSNFDLSHFPNLEVLRLAFEGGIDLYHDDHLSDAQLISTASTCVQSLRRILLSAQSLKTLSITADSTRASVLLNNFELFNLLPRSLYHLASNPTFFDDNLVNQPLFLKALDEGNLPHLRRITLLPDFDYYDPSSHDIYLENLAELRDSCEPFGIVVNLLAVPRNEDDWRIRLITQIDLDQEDTDSDDSDIENISEEEGIPGGQ